MAISYLYLTPKPVINFTVRSDENPCLLSLPRHKTYQELSRRPD